MLSWAQIGPFEERTDPSHAVAKLARTVAGTFSRCTLLPDFIFVGGGIRDTDASLAPLRDMNVPLWRVADANHSSLRGENVGTFRSARSELARATMMRGHRCIFVDLTYLNQWNCRCVDESAMSWLKEQLLRSTADLGRPLVFVNALPPDNTVARRELGSLFAMTRVAFVGCANVPHVDTINDGRVLYGGVHAEHVDYARHSESGLSLSTLDSGVVNSRWQACWEVVPAVFITSPADKRVITTPSSAAHFVWPGADVRAMAFGDISHAFAAIGEDVVAMEMASAEQGVWSARFKRIPEGGSIHIRVIAIDRSGKRASDQIDAVCGYRE